MHHFDHRIMGQPGSKGVNYILNFFFNILDNFNEIAEVRGGYKTSKFSQFIANSDVKELLKLYKEGEIKSIDALRLELDKIGIKIGLSTLKNYLAELKKVLIKNLKKFF